MSTKATYATTYQLGSLLAALRLKKTGESKKSRREKTSSANTPGDTKLIKAVTEGMSRTRVPKGLGLLLEFGELVAKLEKSLKQSL